MGDASEECMPTHTLVADARISSAGVGEVTLGSPFATPTIGPPPGALGGTRCSCTEANLVAHKYLTYNYQCSNIYLMPTFNPLYTRVVYIPNPTSKQTSRCEFLECRKRLCIM